MNDEQLQELIGALKRPERSPLQKLLDSALGALVAAVTVGFFALLWNSTRAADNEIADLQQSADRIETTLEALENTFTEEIGDLDVKAELLSEYENGLASHRKAIGELEKRLRALENGESNGDGTETSDSSGASNRISVTLEPARTPNSGELLQKARAKEQAIEERIRQYEQRRLPKQ